MTAASSAALTPAAAWSSASCPAAWPAAVQHVVSDARMILQLSAKFRRPAAVQHAAALLDITALCAPESCPRAPPHLDIFAVRRYQPAHDLALVRGQPRRRRRAPRPLLAHRRGKVCTIHACRSMVSGADRSMGSASSTQFLTWLTNVWHCKAWFPRRFVHAPSSRTAASPSGSRAATASCASSFTCEYSTFVS